MKALSLLALVSVLGLATSFANAQEFSPEELRARAIERRAVEAVNWGIPVVNYDRMFQAFVAAGGGANQIVYWSGLSDWKNQTLTPNPDVVYFKPFFDTREAGPMVLEIPPAGDDGSITGTIMDVWQAALEDAGTAGVDKGAGGKYLILPPGHADPIPDGYIPLPSSTYQGFALLRSVLKSGSEEGIQRAVDYGKRIRLYPLSHADNRPETTMVDVHGQVFDATIPYDLSFFQALDRVVQYEPWLERDKAMIDVLRTVGIEKGRPFAPDRATQEALLAGITEAHAWLDLRYETSFPPYFEGTRWAIPAMPELMKTAATFFESENSYSVDARGLTDYWAFSSVKHLGEGQFYLMSTRDADGDPLDGARNYRLTVPADAPATQYWSAVVYDRATHALVRDMTSPSKSSQSPGLVTNPDGTVDLWFGPEAPPGKDSNWTPTKPGGQFEVLFRIYGPEKPLFDKTWILPDIAKAG
jgi:hypothetical protein